MTAIIHVGTSVVTTWIFFQVLGTMAMSENAGLCQLNLHLVI